jgi:hypothetical protein
MLATRNDAIRHVLHLLEFEMLAPMGVNRHVKADWRTIGQEFVRIGLYSLPVEQLICWLDLFLQHYQTGLTISSKLRASLEALQLKLGCRGNPLLENFSTLGCLATDSWLVAVWERLCSHNFTIHLDYPLLLLPRTYDLELVQTFVEWGEKGNAL